MLSGVDAPAYDGDRAQGLAGRRPLQARGQHDLRTAQP